MSNEKSSSSGLGFGAILALIFITLKLTHFIDWSWWWVLSPFWLPLAIIVIVFGVTFLIAMISENNKRY